MTYPTIMPALTLDFQNSQQLDPRVTFSRSSSATYINSAGLVTSAADHEPRFDHDPETGECLGLLVEESRTNSNYPSNDLLDSRYTISPDFSTSNVVAPDGSNDAVYFAETVGQNSLYVNPTAPSTTYTSATGSVYVKLIGNRQYFAIRQVVASNNFVRATFDVANESYKFVVGDVDTRSSYSADIKNVGNGWYRCSLTVGYSSATTIGMYFSPSDSDTGGSVTNSGYGAPTNTAIANSGMVLWGYQLEAGSFASSLIPTSGSALVRSPDIAQVTTADIYGDEFTIINKPFGVSSGSDTLHLQGYPHVERAVVYNDNLSQEQINTVAGVDEFWRWRILGSSFALPSFTTDGQVTVDWGDGTVETLTTSEHTFTNGGGYHDVGFRLDSGTNFYPRLNNNATHKDKVIAVGPGPESMKVDLFNMLNGASNLVSIDSTISLISASNRKLRESICTDCTSLKSFPYIDFSGASLSSIRYAWKNCTSMESFPLLDLSQAYNLGDAGGRGTWVNCSSLKSFPAIHFPNVIIALSAWNNCSSMTEFNATGFGLCTAFNSAWSGCSSLTSFPLIDTSSGTNFSSTWRSCSSLTSFPLIDTSSGTNFYFTWYNCNSLASFPAGFFDSWSATPSNQCFYQTWDGCSSLTATSVDNILVSIAASGVSAPSGTNTHDKKITIDYDGTTLPGTTTTAITTLKSRNWAIYLNGVLQ